MLKAYAGIVVAAFAVPFFLGVRSAWSVQCYTASAFPACGCVASACQPCLNGSCPGTAKACNLDFIMMATPTGVELDDSGLEPCWTGFYCGPVNEEEPCGPSNPCTQKRATESQEKFLAANFKDCPGGGGGAQ